MLIAGPCSIESFEQFSLCVAQILRFLPSVDYIRCGVWKPRTRPGGFEGLGEVALEYVARVREQWPQARFCCEVANARHVELAMRYGIDAVWVGARTAGNPFSVSEVAQALRGTSLLVMVKNPPAPDVKLWIGAIERLSEVGVSNLLAVHRGFDLYNNYGFRNSPLWEVPIELRRRMPDLPILCDPSHIAGKRSLLLQVAQTAMDIGVDGLMFEVHPTPDAALTDSLQQETPENLSLLLQHLRLPETHASQGDQRLSALRRQIDLIDEQLLQTLARRFSVVEDIAAVKEQTNMPVYLSDRWDSLLQKNVQKAMDLGLDADFAKALFEKIHAESVRLQSLRRAAKDEE